jgi:hypothetical protein
VFSDEELELIEEVVALFKRKDADSYPEVRMAQSILDKIEEHLNG